MDLESSRFLQGLLRMSFLGVELLASISLFTQRGIYFQINKNIKKKKKETRSPRYRSGRREWPLCVSKWHENIVTRMVYYCYRGMLRGQK